MWCASDCKNNWDIPSVRKRKKKKKKVTKKTKSHTSAGYEPCRAEEKIVTMHVMPLAHCGSHSANTYNMIFTKGHWDDCRNEAKIICRRTLTRVPWLLDHIQCINLMDFDSSFIIHHVIQRGDGEWTHRDCNIHLALRLFTPTMRAGGASCELEETW